MEDKVVKSSDIQIKVGLNENNLPIGIKWSAADGGVENRGGGDRPRRRAPEGEPVGN